VVLSMASEPSGLCVTCRYVTSRLFLFPVGPSALSRYCVIKASPLATARFRVLAVRA